MKKLLLILTLIASAFFANAQTEQQTLEWLNIKKSSFAYLQIPAINVYLFSGKDWDNLIFNSTSISFTSNKGAIDINYNDIREIINPKFEQLAENSYFVLKVKTTKANELLSFWSNDYALTEKFVKALKHIAILKGAKLVDDNLFGN